MRFHNDATQNRANRALCPALVFTQRNSLWLHTHSVLKFEMFSTTQGQEQDPFNLVSGDTSWGFAMQKTFCYDCFTEVEVVAEHCWHGSEM